MYCKLNKLYTVEAVPAVANGCFRTEPVHEARIAISPKWIVIILGLRSTRTEIR
jgi:hypothetical protein